MPDLKNKIKKIKLGVWLGGLSGILPKMAMGQMAKGAHFSDGYAGLKKKRKKKKNEGSDHTVPGWWSGVLSCVLTKIACGTNGRKVHNFQRGMPDFKIKLKK